MKNVLLLATTALMCINSQSFAQQASGDPIISALNNTQHEMTICVAYYKTVSICMDNIGDKKASQVYTKAAENLLTYSVIIAMEIGLSEDAVISRRKMASEDMYNLMKGQCINISSAMRRYGTSCPELSKDPLKSIAPYLR